MSRLVEGTSVHLSEFVGSVDEIKTWSEGAFCLELSKYLNEKYGCQLALDGVGVCEELEATGVGSFFRSYGLKFEKKYEIDVAPMELDRLLSIRGSLPTLEYECSGGVVSCVLTGSGDNSIIGDNSAVRWLCALVQLVVREYENGRGITDGLRFELGYVYAMGGDNINLVHLYTLKHYGNAWFKDSLQFPDDEDDSVTQLGWFAFHKDKLTKGKMCREYSINEKLSELRKFNVGDALLLYTQGKATKSKDISRLESVQIVVYKGVQGNSVVLDVCDFSDTFATRDFLFETAYSYMDGEIPYFDIEDEKFRFGVVNSSYNIYTLGVCDATFKESVFLLEPFTYDGDDLYFYYNDPHFAKEYCDTLDVIYASLEDRGIEWNAKDFVERYMKPLGRTPIYEKYRKWNRG